VVGSLLSFLFGFLLSIGASVLRRSLVLLRLKLEMKKAADAKNRLDDANVQLRKELWLIKSGLAVYQVIVSTSSRSSPEERSLV